MNPEFSIRPFAAGSVVGLRSFAVTPDYQLSAVTRRVSWIPGQNMARCLRVWWRPPDSHRVGVVGCSCGFYAYFDGTNDYANMIVGVSVTGIVEGYGLVTVGSRGFRAEKARIVALVEPSTFDFAPVRENYPDVPVYATEAEALAAHPLTKPQDVGITPSDRPARPGLHFAHVHAWRKPRP